jgi:hypothetical protein
MNLIQKRLWKYETKQAIKAHQTKQTNKWNNQTKPNKQIKTKQMEHSKQTKTKQTNTNPNFMSIISQRFTPSAPPYLHLILQQL